MTGIGDGNGAWGVLGTVNGTWEVDGNGDGDGLGTGQNCG